MQTTLLPKARPQETACTKIKFEVLVPYELPYKGKSFTDMDDKDEEELKMWAEKEAVDFVREQLGDIFAEKATPLIVDFKDFYAGWVQIDLVCALKGFKVPLSG